MSASRIFNGPATNAVVKETGRSPPLVKLSVTRHLKTKPHITPSFIIFSVADPDLGSHAFLNPGWVKIRIRIRDEQPVSYFRERRNNFWVKYLNSLMQIRGPEWKQFGSGMGKIRIRDLG
jgi:hypothetical protein